MGDKVGGGREKIRYIYKMAIEVGRCDEHPLSNHPKKKNTRQQNGAIKK